MADSPTQPSHDAQEMAEFLAIAREALPHLETLVMACRKLFGEAKSESKPSPCEACSDECEHTEPCRELEKYLSGIHSGKLHGEGTSGLKLDLIRDNSSNSEDELNENNNTKYDHSKLKHIEKVQSIDVFGEYQKCFNIFTFQQREALYLHYKEGLSITMIAKNLGKAKSGVSELLKRAEQRKKHHDTEQHEELLGLRQKMEIKQANIRE